MSNLVYPHQNLWQFLVNDEPDFDLDDWRGDTQPVLSQLDIAIVDIGDDDDFDPYDGFEGGR